jgi:hypothetical protein
LAVDSPSPRPQHLGFGLRCGHSLAGSSSPPVRVRICDRFGFVVFVFVVVVAVVVVVVIVDFVFVILTIRNRLGFKLIDNLV